MHVRDFVLANKDEIICARGLNEPKLSTSFWCLVDVVLSIVVSWCGVMIDAWFLLFLCF